MFNEPSNLVSNLGSRDLRRKIRVAWNAVTSSADDEVPDFGDRPIAAKSA